MQLESLLAVVLLISVAAKGEENATETKRLNRQQDALFEDSYDLLSPFYWPSSSFYFYRTLPWISGYMPKSVEEKFASFKSDVNDPESRLLSTSSLINAALFNNRFSNNNNGYRLFPNFPGRLPLMINPNADTSWKSFQSCVSVDGESGICTSNRICGVFNGRSSGSCPLGGICCVNAVTRCGGTVTLNNTYWQSPSNAASSTSTCSLTVKLDARLLEQKQPICQVRLDLNTFSIAQPNSEGVCAFDTFQVGGALNSVPIICGDNAAQHMYINVPNSGLTKTDLQMIFTLGTGVTTPRSWNIKIAMLPCGVDYLAPVDCLQYFTSSSGTVSSFNWKDVPLAVRQLANQDYQICFRSELVNGGKTSSLCLSQCTTTNANVAFRLTGSAVTSQATGQAGVCSNDFLLIANGYDPSPAIAIIAGQPIPYTDRFCGGVFNAAASSSTAGTVCSNVKPFRIFYRTNGDETITAPTDGTGGAIAQPANNMGFCLTFLQRTS